MVECKIAKKEEKKCIKCCDFCIVRCSEICVFTEKGYACGNKLVKEDE